jgi:hypothetical protein
MLRLTLRSGKDGRFLCRIVDRDGFPFVLDFGDRRIIEDASQRLLHGFTMWRHGRLISAPPQDPDMMPLLAEYYAGEGLLVFLEEPNWSFRDGSMPEEPAGGYYTDDLPEFDDRTELSDDLTELAELDDQTELAHIDDSGMAPPLGPDPDDPDATVRDVHSADEVGEEDETVKDG